ncbi:MAG: hypothetical protein ACYST3_07220 [Planctomycetota bacterium]|jgi:hypothetical protein
MSIFYIKPTRTGKYLVVKQGQNADICLMLRDTLEKAVFEVQALVEITKG